MAVQTKIFPNLFPLHHFYINTGIVKTQDGKLFCFAK